MNTATIRLGGKGLEKDQHGGGIHGISSLLGQTCSDSGFLREGWSHGERLSLLRRQGEKGERAETEEGAFSLLPRSEPQESESRLRRVVVKRAQSSRKSPTWVRGRLRKEWRWRTEYRNPAGAMTQHFPLAKDYWSDSPSTGATERGGKQESECVVKQ